MKNADRPAMPFTGSIPDTQAHPAEGARKAVSELGLTKREHFAAMAMQGLCANFDCITPVELTEMAFTAVKCADALLEELEK